MNKEEILAMAAGSEIDALIAEKVMGWKRAVATDGATEYWDDGSFCSGRLVEPTVGGFRLDDYSNTWNPSESISAAWEVLAKMGHAQINKKVNGEYAVRWGNTRWADSPVCVSKSAPEAICKAALLAVMDS